MPPGELGLQSLHLPPALHLICTFVEILQGLQHSPPEGCHGVLNAGPKAQHALEVRLPEKLLPIGCQLRGAAEQGSNIVDELRHQAGVGVICLAVVIGNHLRKKGEHTDRLISSKGSSQGRACVCLVTKVVMVIL